MSNRPIIALQMDPLETIRIETDTSFALGLEAQRRGYRLFHYTPENLIYMSGKVSALGNFVSLTDALGNHFTINEGGVRIDLAEVEIILMRQDPPFNLAYITATHLLELLPRTTRVINSPKGVRNSPEKLLVTHFPELAAPTLITHNHAAIDAFIEEHHEVVLKPLYDFGGNAVFKITSKDSNRDSLLELFFRTYPEPPMIQKFIPEIAEGDKRIILIDGEPVGIFKRIPAHGQIRSNMRVGGTPEPCEYTLSDREICTIIGPILKERGLMLAGIDIIGPYLTEINVTSPTGLRVMDRMYGLNLASVFWDSVLS